MQCHATISAQVSDIFLYAYVPHHLRVCYYVNHFRITHTGWAQLFDSVYIRRMSQNLGGSTQLDNTYHTYWLSKCCCRAIRKETTYEIGWEVSCMFSHWGDTTGVLSTTDTQKCIFGERERQKKNLWHLDIYLFSGFERNVPVGHCNLSSKIQIWNPLKRLS